MDLFNDYPISEKDIELWLDAIPNLSKAKYRRDAYRVAYNVEQKIRAAKAAGNWPPSPPNQPDCQK